MLYQCFGRANNQWIYQNKLGLHDRYLVTFSGVILSVTFSEAIPDICNQVVAQHATLCDPPFPAVHTVRTILNNYCLSQSTIVNSRLLSEENGSTTEFSLHYKHQNKFECVALAAFQELFMFQVFCQFKSSLSSSLWHPSQR